MATMAKKQPRMSAEEKEWQARSDVDTVIQYNRIMKDHARKKAMQAQAKKMMDGLNMAAGGSK